jgi:hypothetical protein
MSASRITRAHLSVSPRTKRANSAAVIGAASRPTLAKLARISGICRIFTISVFRRSTISGFTPARVNIPYQVITTTSGMPASAVVGTCAIEATRSGPSTARPRMRPELMKGMVAGTVETTMSTSPPSIAVIAIDAPL